MSPAGAYDIRVMIEFPPYRLDRAGGRLWRGERAIALRPKAWALLVHLVERPGILITKDELQAAIWGDTFVSDDTLTRTIAELRHVLHDDARTPRIIETVHRRGVRFIARLHGSRDWGSAATVPATPTRPARSEATFLVGRDAELARLDGLWRLALSGQRQVVFVEGEPGIGKSALVEAFFRAVPPPARVGYGQCVEQFGAREPFMPVLEALERLHNAAFGPRMRSALRTLAPSWLAQMPGLQRPTDTERLHRWHADTTPHRMLREFANLVEATSSEHPLLLVLEDLHWSDQGTVDLLSMLAQRPERARIMLIGTYRRAQATALDHPIQHVPTMLRQRNQCTNIALEYLNRPDAAAYLAHRFPGSRVTDDVIDVVHALTDGNPLFMTVLVDHLLARGWLSEDGAVWRLTVTRATIESDVPHNVRELIEGQLRFFSPEERNALEAASVAGLVFDTPAVAAACQHPADEVESLCHRLSSARSWLQPLGTREWPDGTLASRYTFQHALYQRTLYDRTSPTRRATLHARIGARIEAGFADRTEEVSSELARHFEGARAPQRALVYLEQGARRAYDRRAYRDVMTCLETALPLLGDLSDAPARANAELRLRRLYAVVQSQTEGYAAAALGRNLTRIQELAAELDDSASLFDARCGLLLLRSSSAAHIEAAEVGDQLSGLADRLGPSAVLQCHFLQGNAALWSGDLRAAATLFAKALSSPASLDEADRPYAVNPIVAARSLEALRRWVVADTAGARIAQSEALALAEHNGRPFTIAHATAFCALLSLLEEEWADAARFATRAIDVADEYGFPRWRGTALVVRGRALIEDSAESQGLAMIRDGLDALTQAGLNRGNTLLLSLLTDAYLRLNHGDKGLAVADEGLIRCRDTGERLFEAELWRLRGELLRRGARPGREVQRVAALGAHGCFERARTLAGAQGALMLERRIDLSDPGVGPRRSP